MANPEPTPISRMDLASLPLDANARVPMIVFNQNKFGPGVGGWEPKAATVADLGGAVLIDTNVALDVSRAAAFAAQAASIAGRLRAAGNSVLAAAAAAADEAEAAMLAAQAAQVAAEAAAASIDDSLIIQVQVFS